MRWWMQLVLGYMVLCVAVPSVSAKIYKGAEYRTKKSYLYGRFEVRMKANGKEGMLSSFFTYNDSYPSTPWNEIDIEILGRYTDDVQFNAITPGQIDHVSHRYVAFNPAVDYHNYGFEWTPDYVAWFIDGAEVYRQTGSHIATLNIPQKIMMNVWAPVYTDWIGTWNEAVLPAFAYYDWVSYASYTPGSGSTGTGNNFSPQWTDNFDSWDQAAWDKASHTWNGNNADMLPDNAVFQNGKLILCLTKETAVGYVDGVPPMPLSARAEGTRLRVRFAEEVEENSATTLSNYLIPGASATSAQLLPDLKTVLLNVSGLDTTSASAIIIRNILDRWSSPNQLGQQPVPLIRQLPLPASFKINVGGPVFQSFLSDQLWSDSVEYGRMDGQQGYFSGATINGTNDQEVFRSEVSNLCEYKVRVPNGRYVVVLSMAENYFTGAGQRLFSVVVEGTMIDSALDLYSRVGYRTLFQRATTVDVNDGTLDIHFQGLVDRPLLNSLTLATVTGVQESPAPGGIRGYLLYPNYPNPFNHGTVIRFSLPRADVVHLKVFDSLGREVSDRLLGNCPRGECTAFWDAEGSDGMPLPSGVYFYRIEGREASGMRKMLFVK